MAVQLAPIVIGAAALGLGYWLLAGGSPAPVVDPAVKGDADGCAAGTADGKAGRAELYNPTDDAAVKAAAKLTNDPVVYLDKFEIGYRKCFTANNISKDVVLTPPPIKGPSSTPKTPLPPAAVPKVFSRVEASAEWILGCSQGKRDGLNDGHAGKSRGAPPGTAPYRAGWQNIYGAAKISGAVDEAAGLDGQHSDLLAGCGDDFGDWYDKNQPIVKTAGVAGVDGSESETSVEVSGRAKAMLEYVDAHGSMVGFHEAVTPKRPGLVIAGFAVVGARRAPVEIVHGCRSCSGEGGRRQDSTIYRSY